MTATMPAAGNPAFRSPPPHQSAASGNQDKIIPCANILGINVSAITLPEAVAAVQGWIDSDKREYVCVTGVHGIMESRRDRFVGQIHNSAGMVTADGMPLVWLLHWRGFTAADRVYGPDLMLMVMEKGLKRGDTHFLFGSAPDTLARLEHNLLCQFPTLNLAGALSPPFRTISASEDAAIVETLNASGADIIWVGLGTPKQERWMAAHRQRLRAKVLIAVGAAFDFHAGTVRQAPRWVQRSGFEWLFRLTLEPRRLWQRYATNNPLFILLVVTDWLGLKRFSLIRSERP